MLFFFAEWPFLESYFSFMQQFTSEVKLVWFTSMFFFLFVCFYYHRCSVTVWYGERHPLYRSYAEEEDRCPPPSG